MKFVPFVFLFDMFIISYQRHYYMHVYCVDKLQCDIVCVCFWRKDLLQFYTRFSISNQKWWVFVSTCHVCAHTQRNLNVEVDTRTAVEGPLRLVPSVGPTRAAEPQLEGVDRYTGEFTNIEHRGERG